MPRIITMKCEMPSVSELEVRRSPYRDWDNPVPMPKYERPAPFTEVPPSRPTDAIDDSHGPLVQVLLKQVRDLEQQNGWLQQSNNQLLERARRAEALNREYQERMSPSDTA